MNSPPINIVQKIANDALKTANKANNKIDSHEEVCSIRYDGIAQTMNNIQRDIQILSTRMWVAAGATIGACIGLIVFLLARH